MTDGPEDLALRILQEMRGEMHAMCDDLTARLTELTQRIEGNTLTLNRAARVGRGEERITKLED